MRAKILSMKELKTSASLRADTVMHGIRTAVLDVLSGARRTAIRLRSSSVSRVECVPIII